MFGFTVLAAVAIAMCTSGTTILLRAFRGRSFRPWRDHTPVTVTLLWNGGAILLYAATVGFSGHPSGPSRLVVGFVVVLVVVAALWYLSMMVHDSRLADHRKSAAAWG
ncbi:MAG: hypothetical protein ABI382_12290 [Nakamurella sp.]